MAEVSHLKREAFVKECVALTCALCPYLFHITISRNLHQHLALACITSMSRGIRLHFLSEIQITASCVTDSCHV